MRLGEWLVQQGAIAGGQLETALRAQVTYGGRLGTLLVEANLLTLDDIANALAARSGIAPALQQHFDRIDPFLMKLVPPELAQRHRAIPLGFTRTGGRKLAVGFMDPLTQGDDADEISRAAGVPVVLCIAPELRVMYYLEKLYGIERKPRFKRMEPRPEPTAAAPARSRRVTGVQEMPGVSIELPPPMEPVKQQVAQVLPPAPSKAVEVPLPPAPSKAIEVPLPPPRPVTPVPIAARAVAAAAARAAAAAPVAAAPAVPPPPATPFAGPRAPTPPPMPPRRPEIPAADAIARLATATERDAIGDLVVDHLRVGFGTGLCMVVKQEMAIGWKGISPDVDETIIRAITLPLGQPSVLKAAYDQRKMFRGPPPSEASMLNNLLWKILQTPVPDDVVVVPIAIKARVINLVYAHGYGDPIAENIITDMLAVCEAAAAAFARMITAAKKKA